MCQTRLDIVFVYAMFSLVREGTILTLGATKPPLLLAIGSGFLAFLSRQHLVHVGLIADRGEGRHLELVGG